MILDPDGRSRHDADRDFSDRLARSFRDAGFEVVWVIDADDPLPERSHARLQRLASPEQAAPGAMPGSWRHVTAGTADAILAGVGGMTARAAAPGASEQIVGEVLAGDRAAPEAVPGVRAEAARGPVAAATVGDGAAEGPPLGTVLAKAPDTATELFGAAPTGPANGSERAKAPRPGPRWIERRDNWARASWKSPSSGLIVKVAAFLLWASIRTFYRGEYALALLVWSCSRTPRLLAGLYWCTYRWTGVTARAARWSYWRLAHPVLEKSVRAARWSYWHLVYPVLEGGMRAARLNRWRLVPPRFGWSRVSVLLSELFCHPGAPDNPQHTGAGDKRSRGAPNLDHEAPGEAVLARLIATLGTDDVLVFPSAQLSHVEMLLKLLPYLSLSRPIPTTLHVRFAASCGETDAPTDEDGAMLAMRLRSGSPIRTIVLHAETAKQRSTLERKLGLQVHECPQDLSPAALRRRFAPAGGTLDVPPSLVVSRFGPVALLISALWGRVGSSTVFDAQTRYLLERGFIVARILIDHYPQTGAGRLERLERMLAENFERVRPHLHFIAERREGFRHLSQLHARDAFREGSPVGRMGMLLADARIDRPAAVAWCADSAVLAVVNHLPHVAFAERLTKAPIVLETHDIFAKLLKTHGIPGFVPRGPDGDHRREAEEAAVWRRVAACVNLSPDDHAVIARTARRSTFARPYADRIERRTRPWAEVLAANPLSASLGTAIPFDIMLWGDWHEGNVSGVRWFLEQVVHRHAVLEQASILLAGRVIRGLPRRLLRRKRLYAVGFVDCLDDFFARSTVLVIPDRPGSTGTSIKAMDALARGCCFASTAAGLRGVTLVNTGLVPSDDPAAFARDIASLLQSPDARSARADLARTLYEINFSRAAHSQAWDMLLDAVLPGLPGAASSRASRGLPIRLLSPSEHRSGRSDAWLPPHLADHNRLK